ncbi:hypothetical protein NITLEN_20133 [Nitrospira lenta]|uniref:Uncharacterized protein n=1 Tax=Nitrospira lenta TaxID=1436998 RepID=A0A330L407_9BACT|nr:hypothetical protein NITLEN_20133 [Nitrospira lenta]
MKREPLPPYSPAAALFFYVVHTLAGIPGFLQEGQDSRPPRFSYESLDTGGQLRKAMLVTFYS